MATTINKVIASSGGDYTSLANFEAALPASLVTADEVWRGEHRISGDAGATFSGSTTDATRYVDVYATGSYRHAGKWDATKSYITANVYGGVIVVNDGHVYFDGVQVDNTTTGSNNPICIIYNATGIAKIENSILRTSNTDTKTSGANVNLNGTLSVYMSRNQIYHGNHGILFGYITATNVCLYNNTLSNFAGDGIQLQGTNGNYRLANNIVTNCGTCYNLFPDGGLDYSATNISSDTSSPDASYRSLSPSFVSTTVGSEDFHLQSSDTAAKDAGTDLSADAYYAFSTDIDGATRSGTWDIGADEYVSAGGAVQQFFSLLGIGS